MDRKSCNKTQIKRNGLKAGKGKDGVFKARKKGLAGGGGGGGGSPPQEGWAAPPPTNLPPGCTTPTPHHPHIQNTPKQTTHPCAKSKNKKNAKRVGQKIKKVLDLCANRYSGGRKRDAGGTQRAAFVRRVCGQKRVTARLALRLKVSLDGDTERLKLLAMAFRGTDFGA